MCYTTSNQHLLNPLALFPSQGTSRLSSARSFGSHDPSEWFQDLLKPSDFSNLPIASCHYRHCDDTSDLQQWVTQRVVLRLCQLYLAFQTLCRLFDVWGLLYSAICVVLVCFCEEFGMTAPVPASIYISVLIFPLAFAVNAAYQRREGALGHVRSVGALRVHVETQWAFATSTCDVRSVKFL